MAAAAALDVEGVDRAPAERLNVSSTTRASLRPSVWIAELHVVAVGDVERAADLLGSRADVLVDLQPAAAGAQRAPRPARAATRRRARAARR